LKVKNFFIERFNDGELMKTLKDYVDSQKIRGGMIFVLGFLNGVSLGVFNWKKKEYDKINVNKEVEIVSCYGNLARKKENDQLIIHMHGVVSDNKGRTYGGHILKGRIKLVEVMILETDKLTRSYDKGTNLYFLDV
jgi:hypothetical protein